MKNNKPKIKVCITSLGATRQQYKNASTRRTQLEDYFEVSIDSSVIADDLFGSRRALERAKSLKDALKNSDLALSWDGGFNAVELLEYSELFGSVMPANFAGYSDNTIIANALQNISFYGPSMDDYLQPRKLNKNAAKSLYMLYKNDLTEYSKLFEDEVVTVIQSGEMKGQILGGNNYSFSLLQGNKFCPKFDNPFILFMEGEDILSEQKYVWRDFIRNIDAIMALPDAKNNLQGLLVGKFPETFKVQGNEVAEFVRTREYLKNIPIVFDVPCGHGPKPLYLPLRLDVVAAVSGKQLSFREIKKYNK